MEPSEEVLNKLYIERKHSVSEIAKIFKCSENRINYWIRKFKIQKRSLADAMYTKYNPDGDPFLIKEPQTLEEAKLLGLGLGLYWGEGNKKNRNSIRLGNTDPRMIRMFLRFMVDIFGISKKKLRFGLQVFSDMQPKRTLTFWLGELKEFQIKEEQFFKITVTPSRSIGNYREKSKFGVLTVHFANTKLKKIIDNMLPL
ncbi:MAG: helix-turn-helix domain-containing protein [Candidatus Yanofskybacteria bacterium]|nr:helix-turn-helix domain-containing protein [Candidatus Yanofskybacteria bacterium]